jgi:hypothetical protein
MKRQLRLIGAAIGLCSLVLATLAMTPNVSADSAGQIDGGQIYQIANLTQNSKYMNPAYASACDEVEYSIQLHNPNYASVNDINVSATLPASASTTNTSDLTITYTGGSASVTTASATLDLTSAQTVTYESGTTVLYAGNGSKIATLPDGITGSGVNVGSLDGSTTEYLNFKAKVNCPVTPPVTPSYACTLLGLTAEDNRTVKISNFTTAQTNATFSNATITWGDNTEVTSASPIGQTHQYAADGKYTVTATANFNVSGQTKSATSESCTQVVTFSSNTPPTVTPPATPTPVAPTALVNTGPGSVIGLFAATSIGGMALYRRLLARRLSRQ